MLKIKLRPHNLNLYQYCQNKKHSLQYDVNEGFVIFFTSKLITCFIDGFTLTMIPQSIVQLLNGSGHIYWILDLEGEGHSIWDLWVSGLQECKSNEFFRNQAGGLQFLIWSRKFLFYGRAAAPARFGHTEKFVRGSLTSSLLLVSFGGFKII